MPARALLAVPGVALVLLALADTVLTAIRVDQRGGPVTRWASGLLWRAFHGGGERRHSGPPPITGVVITIAIVVVWVSLAVSGWFLLFLSDANAVVDATTGQAADPWARLYYTMFTLSTLGLGDYTPAGAPWQVLTGIASGFGFAMATLVITYLAGVAAAVTAKRQLARSIWGMGGSAQEIVRRAWDGQRFTVLPEHLQTLMPILHGVAEQHRAYPLISYFTSPDREAADMPAIAILHDTLTILSAADDEHQLSPLVIEPMYAAIDVYLHALPGSGQDPRSSTHRRGRTSATCVTTGCRCVRSRSWTSPRRPTAGGAGSGRSCTTRGGAGGISRMTEGRDAVSGRTGHGRGRTSRHDVPRGAGRRREARQCGCVVSW